MFQIKRRYSPWCQRLLGKAAGFSTASQVLAEAGDRVSKVYTGLRNCIRKVPSSIDILSTGCSGGYSLSSAGRMGEAGAAAAASGLCSFDPVSSELYASVSSDNRLRIWTTATGQLRQQYVESQHLAKQYTCIAWHRRASKSKRNSSGSAKPSSMGLIALGTDKGTISIWDLKRGALAHSLGEGEGLPSVTSVAFSLDGSILYSASSGKDILEWDLVKGTVSRKLKGFKHGSTEICLHPLGKVLAIASSSIRLLDLASGKRARKFSASHAGTVRQLTFSADGRYLASSAASTRFANVFDVAGENASSEPVATLGFPAAPTFLTLHAGTGDGVGGLGDQLTVIAGFDTGGVSVLRTRRRTDGKDGAIAKLEIQGVVRSGDKRSSPSALYACLSAERPSSAVLIATGSPASPGFTESLFQDESGALLSTVTVENGNASLMGGRGEGADGDAVGAKSALAHVVGPGELGMKGLEVDGAALLSGNVGDGKEVDKDGRALKRLKGDTGGVGGEEAGMSIAERLEALSEEIDQEGSRRAVVLAETGGTLALSSTGGMPEQPRVESLSTVLTQALQSGDNGLLEKCLNVGQQSVIEATVERLPSSKVLPFLLRVVGKMEKRPNRAPSLGRWIRALLSCHLGYLVSVPGLPEKLALLHQLIDRRVASFPKLIQLQGRLDLLLARAKSGGGGERRAGVGGGGGAARLMDKPAAVYSEGEEEEESEGQDDDDDEEDEDEDEDEDEGAVNSGQKQMEEIEDEDCSTDEQD